MAVRERIKRAMLMTLMFSNGTPMLPGGDEFGRTQQGNNNPYCQDNEISWFDWSLAESDAGKALIDFTRRCIAARLARPTLRSTRFLTASAKTLEGVPDTGWFDETGNEMTPERWNFAGGRLLALRRIASERHGSKAGPISASLLLLNASSEDREFILPQPVIPWHTEIDAAEPAGESGPGTVPKHQPRHNKIMVAGHSAVLLIADHVTL
jgi:glycogen operon protein